MPEQAQPTDIAVIVGGADCVWRDLGEAERRFPVARYFITNSMLAHLDRPGIGVTLHPDLLAKWLTARRAKDLPELEAMFVHRPFRDCTVFAPQWRGSVGLFATEIARKHYGYARIILCGCPMTMTGGHFERKKLWHDAVSFRKGWIEALPELRPCVRSMSGWTRDQFGLPTEGVT